MSVPEIQELERFAAHLEVRVENATLRKAATAHGAIHRELSRAHAIQRHLLPRRAPAYPTLDCAAAALSSEPVGGDYYDFVKVPGRVLTLAVGDAAGKGVPGALMGVWAQACFRNEARRGAGPGQVLTALNRELVSMDQPEAFVALACMRVDVRPARLTYANAGLTPPLLRRASGAVEVLSESGVLLGVTTEARYADTRVDLEAGDIVVLYTDGLTEARHGEDMFGPERLADVLEMECRAAGRRDRPGPAGSGAELQRPAARRPDRGGTQADRRPGPGQRHGPRESPQAEPGSSRCLSGEPARIAGSPARAANPRAAVGTVDRAGSATSKSEVDRGHRPGVARRSALVDPPLTAELPDRG